MGAGDPPVVAGEVVGIVDTSKIQLAKVQYQRIRGQRTHISIYADNSKAGNHRSEGRGVQCISEQIGNVSGVLVRLDGRGVGAWRKHEGSVDLNVEGGIGSLLIRSTYRISKI